MCFQSASRLLVLSNFANLMEHQVTTPTAAVRRYLPHNHKITNLESITPWLDLLQDEELDNLADLEAWLYKKSEVEAAIYEEKAWRFIRMTCDTANPEAQAAYQAFNSDIVPHITQYSQNLRKKLHESPAFGLLSPKEYEVMVRQIKNDLALFREENIPLITQADELAREFDRISSQLTIQVNGEEITLQKAGVLLEDKNRAHRETIWTKIAQCRISKADELDNLFEQMVQIRHQIGQNAGYDSFADYKLLAMGRFDYGREKCISFHQSIERVILPLYESQMGERRNILGVESVKPWDSFFNIYGDRPLRPFADTHELVEKSIIVLDKIRDGWGKNIQLMREMGQLDLDNRMGKATGGYNYTLPESGMPFIFMNAVGTHTDLVTMMHESGHALHSVATRQIMLSEFRYLPSEIAELAAMSMEFLSMDYWDVFYEDPEELARAKRDQIQRPIVLLPWIATVDAFQFWVYDNPQSGIPARRNAFAEIYKRHHGNAIDYQGQESTLLTSWHKQRHIFDLPFYYIEYGIAQLGAIAIWRNFRKDPERALDQFWHALSLGYTRPIPEIYAAAGIQFDFSEAYIQELAEFMEGELHNLPAPKV